MKKTEKQEILDAIKGLDQKLSGKIDVLASDIHSLKDDVHELKEDLRDMHGAMNAFSSETDRRFTRVEALMVTKEYLDRKLADHHIRIVDFVKARVPSWREPSSG